MSVPIDQERTGVGKVLCATYGESTRKGPARF
jgi:hypothetical protein